MSLPDDKIPEELTAMLNDDLSHPADPPKPATSANSDSVDEFDRLLDDFISQQLAETEENQQEAARSIAENRPLYLEVDPPAAIAASLDKDERQLYDAYRNFVTALYAMADEAGLDRPQFIFNPEMLYPHFRPSRPLGLNEDILEAWNLMLQAQPVRLSQLPAKASDEQILEYAEKTTDMNLQMALISYVEILIELEGCEIAYNLRKAKAERRKIERALYEEHQHRQQRMKDFIDKIRLQNFPIDAERLVTNYFKTAKKDPDGAQKILENNPATFAPIQTDKIPPRFFGMIKPKPEDGIRINKEIGKYLKNLKA